MIRWGARTPKWDFEWLVRGKNICKFLCFPFIWSKRYVCWCSRGWIIGPIYIAKWGQLITCEPQALTRTTTHKGGGFWLTIGEKVHNMHWNNFWIYYDITVPTNSTILTIPWSSNPSWPWPSLPNYCHHYHPFQVHLMSICLIWIELQVFVMVGKPSHGIVIWSCYKYVFV